MIKSFETCFCMSFERTNAKTPTVPIFSELSRNQGPCPKVPKGRTLPKFSVVLSILEKTHYTFYHLYNLNTAMVVLIEILFFPVTFNLPAVSLGIYL